MNYRLISLFLLSLCFACQEDSLETGNAEINPEVILANEANYCKGFIRVKLKEEVQGEIQLNAVRGKVQTGIAEIDRIAEQLGASKIERFSRMGENLSLGCRRLDYIYGMILNLTRIFQ